MGIANIRKTIKNSINSLISFPSNYNLAVDSTLLLIPVLKSSRTCEEFQSNVEKLFSENQKLTQIFAYANEILFSLDYYYPAMKHDTCRKRQKDYQKQHRKLTKNKITVITNAQDSLRLKDVRETIQPLFQRIVTNYIAREGCKIVFDVEGMGEGEIKCFKYSSWKNASLPTIVLSNDNDVLLMMLMHGAMNNFSNKTKFYRLNIINNKKNNESQYVLQDLSLHSILYATNDRFEPNYITDYQMVIDEFNSWIIVSWLIAIYGNDYVNGVQPKYHNCHAHAASKRNYPKEWFQTVIRYYKRLVEDGRCIVFNAHNFFYIITLLFRAISINFDIANSNSDTFQCSPREVCTIDNFQDHRFYGSPIDKNDSETTSVYYWCVRIYWNVLYLKDLPVNFDGTYKSDQSMPVNLKIANPVLQERTISKLTNYQLFKIHDMFCFHTAFLMNFKQTCPPPVQNQAN